MIITKQDVILADNLPRLILLCGPCRSGTTALSNVFVMANIESHMQPLKSMRRAKNNNENFVRWIINNNSSGIIFSKETFGESSPVEFFNPVQDLLDAGYPKDKIETILILRDPVQTFASWKRMWGKIKIENLEKSFFITEEVRKLCCELNISNTTIVHEVIRDNCPNEVASRLFSKLGLGNFPVYANWKDKPIFGSDDIKLSHLFFYDTPPEKFIEGVKYRGSYIFKNIPVTRDDINECKSFPKLIEIYNFFCNLCEKDLNLKINSTLY